MRTMIISLGLFLAGGLTVLAGDEVAEVRFLFWNLRNYQDPGVAVVPVDDDDAEAEERRPLDEELAAAVAGLISAQRPDVAGFCEVSTRADLIALQERIQASGWELPHALFLSGADQRRGLALLSRFPIALDQSAGWVPFELDGHALYVSRGFLDVTLALPPNPAGVKLALRLTLCHLKSPREHYLGAEIIRRYEAGELRQHLERSETWPRGLHLVYGDFNDLRNSPSFKAVQGIPGTDEFLDRLKLADDQGEVWTYFWEPGGVYSAVDHVLVNKALRRKILPGDSRIIGEPREKLREMSDHRPIIVVMGL